MSDTVPAHAAPNAPLSPHLQVWRFTVTMAASITHRITGVANAVGLLLLTAWITSAAISSDAFDAMNGFLGSWLGRLMLFGFALSVTFHILNGLRYLFWDQGRGFSKETSALTGWLAYVGAIALSVLIFVLGYQMNGGA